MKRFLFNILIFSLLFFVIEKVSCILLHTTPNRQYDKRLEYLLKGEINKDLIVLGSSIGAGNIIAGQLEQETGLTSYNLSYLGSNVNFHLFILKTLLKFNTPPKYILLTIDNPSQFIGDKSIRYRVDVLQPLVNYNYINNTLIEENINNRLTHFFCLARLNKSHFKFKLKKKSTNSLLDSSGSMPILRNKNLSLSYNEVIPQYNLSNEISKRMDAFKEIQLICKLNNIELIHVLSPSFQSFNSNFHKRFNSLILPEESLFIYDTLNPIYRDSNFFYDQSHLLLNGAEQFTSEISTFINQNKN